MKVAARLDAVRALLIEVGLQNARVTSAGAADDVAVVHGATPEQLSGLSQRVRALGFRYLTVDLADSAGPDA
jgi:hypothetical protein